MLDSNWILDFPTVVVAGFLSNGDFRSQSVVSVKQGENCHQTAAGERCQRLDGVPHCAAGLTHGNFTCMHKTRMCDVFEHLTGLASRVMRMCQ